jgi:hypothetical protein
MAGPSLGVEEVVQDRHLEERGLYAMHHGCYCSNRSYKGTICERTRHDTRIDAV